VSGFPTTQTKHIDPSKLLKPQLIGPQGDQYTLSLDVEHPIINLFYILRWRPSEKEFDPQNTEKPDKQDLKLIYLAQVRNILIERFSEGELRTLTTDLGVDYEVLPSTGKADIARDLIAYLDRRNRVPDLIKLGQQQRPDITWPRKTD
jgi:hypothetical protein